MKATDLKSLGKGWTDEDIFVNKAEFPGEVRYADQEGCCLLHLAARSEHSVRIEAFYIGGVTMEGLFEREDNGDRFFDAWWKLDGCGDVTLGDGTHPGFHYCDGMKLLIQTMQAANAWAHELLAATDWSVE
jgi:hypothetical protein